MKSLSLLLLWLVDFWPTVSSLDFVVNPWTLQDVDAGLRYPDFNATVGDTITFIFTEVHNVFVHPSGNCENQTGRVTIGNVSPVFYIITDADGAPEGNTMFFACDVDLHCEDYGMSFTVTVYTPLAPVVPTFAPFLPPVTPTDAPVAPVVAPVAPTALPVAPVAPTFAPVLPTEAPVEVTDSPVAPSTPPVEPTSPPVEPTESPVEPTESPLEPTEAPLEPTAPPTDAPVVPPMESPVASPAASPVVAPTEDPTAEPVATPAPTPMPNGKVPTADPAGSITTETLTDLRMTLFGIDEFSVDTQVVWQEDTALFSSSHIFNEGQGQVASFETTYTVTDHLISTRRRIQKRGLTEWLSPSRYLQSDEDFVTVIFTQLMSYEVIGGSAVTPESLATAPFASDTQRASFVSFLELSADPTLEKVSDVTEVEITSSPTAPLAPSAPTAAPSGDDSSSSGLSTGIIIGIACGGGTILLLIIGLVYFMYCRNGASPDSKDDPPMNVLVKDDEVSTLAGPQTVQDGAQRYVHRRQGRHLESQQLILSQLNYRTLNIRLILFFTIVVLSG
jgi:hypothetical protein